MRILVCGGRDYSDYHAVDEALSQIIPRGTALSNIVIIQGGAKGADLLAKTWAAMRGIYWEEYQAEWSLYGKKAGFLRNKRMLDEGQPDLVLAFPGGKGTAMMVDLARKAGVEVIEMGAKGSQAMTDAPPKFRTARYEKIYCDRMGELRGFATPGQRQGILRDLLVEEKEWLDKMDGDYNEIIEAQSVMEKLNGHDPV